MSEQLRSLFPGLLTTPFQVKSPADPDYNCIAWAVGDTTRIWWPVGEGPRIFWPSGVPREETLDAFSLLFLRLGYLAGADEAFEPGFEKIALFANSYDVPTHAARQLSSGRWTSKIGRLEVIEHELRTLEGDIYGTVALVVKRTEVAP